jgi:Icc-related predicted phosphoesterase
MKIVAISDTHLQHDLEIPEGDLLIHSGDATHRGLYSEVKKFGEWFCSLPHKHKIFVPGNHDFLFEENPTVGKALLPGVTVLIDNSLEIDGIKIYGTPYVPTYYDWAFMKPEKDLIEVYAKIPDNLDLLITHGPPYDILDFNQRGDLCGSTALRNAVIHKAPRYHVFGHIHEASGIIQINGKGTVFVNAAVLNDRYYMARQAKVFELSTPALKT